MLRDKLPHALVPRVVANFTFTEVMTYAERGGAPFLAFVESARLMPRREMDGKTYDFQLASSDPFPKISTEAALVWLKARIYPGHYVAFLDIEERLSPMSASLRDKLVALGRERGVIEFDFRTLVCKPNEWGTGFSREPLETLSHLTSMLFMNDRSRDVRGRDVRAKVIFIFAGEESNGFFIDPNFPERFRATCQIQFNRYSALEADPKVWWNNQPEEFSEFVARAFEHPESCEMPDLSEEQEFILESFRAKLLDFLSEERFYRNEKFMRAIRGVSFSTLKEAYCLIRGAVIPMLDDVFRIVRNSIPNAETRSVFIQVEPRAGWRSKEEGLARKLFRGVRANGKWMSIGGVHLRGDSLFEA